MIAGKEPFSSINLQPISWLYKNGLGSILNKPVNSMFPCTNPAKMNLC